jgi:hypothetical protein
MQLGDVKLFEYKIRFSKKYIGYYFSRLLEDIFEILQDIAHPMPYDLYKLIDTEEKYSNLDNQLKDWYYHINLENPNPNKERDFDLLGNKYLWLGQMCTSYLQIGFNTRFLHVENDLIIHYNCTVFEENFWTAKKGIFTIPFDDFLNEIEMLLKTFFIEMDKRVSKAIKILKPDEYSYTNLPLDYIKKFSERAPVKSGPEYLIEENENRKKEFFNILKEVKENSKVYELYWNEVREKLSKIK